MATKKRKLEEITGEYDFQVAVFGNGDSRTIIGKLEIQNQTEPTTIKGPAVEDSLILGLTYRFLGQWKNHHKYGRQFVFNSFVQARPYGERGTVRYLARAKGIGKTIAQRIWNIFGSESLDRLRDDPAAVVVGVPGLRLEVAKAAADAFSHQQGMEAVTIELTDLFDGRGFPRGLTAQVIDKWGNEAVDIIKEEPYKLLAFNGVGFLRADALYLALGLDPGAIERQARCAWHAINNDSNGHTWFPLPFPAQAIKANISGAEANVPGAIRDAFKRGLLVRRNVEGGTWVAEARRARNERTICECLRLAAKEMPDWPYMLKVRDHQQEELSKATQGIIGILAGSPGTGKTYCTAQMIGEIIKSVGDDRIAACAPTGKAAVRLTESLAKEGIDLQATTIHRMLKVEVAPGGAWSFTHNSGNLLPYRYIFVDESSMLDTDLMASLLSARAVGCHVLFVGDPNQLSPVGHGAPLRDMIAAGLPCGMLTEIQRNSGRIVKVCAEIRDTHTFTPSATLDIKGGENLVVLERSNANAQRTALRNILMQLAAGREYDPVWDCQVLCAVNKKSPLARRTLNAELQGLLNPNGKQITGNRFRINDKIICLKNSWLPAADDNDPLANEDGKIYVANGEMGRVLDITPALTVAELESPKRIIKIPKGQSNDDDSDDATDTGCNWDLGYAVSTHKSQGSQWKIVIPMIDSSPAARRVCTREWIYTAFSRAEDACIAIGQKAVAREFCKRSGLGVRKTFLQEDIELWKGSHAPKNTPKQNQLLPAGT